MDPSNRVEGASEEMLKKRQSPMDGCVGVISSRMEGGSDEERNKIAIDNNGQT